MEKKIMLLSMLLLLATGLYAQGNFQFEKAEHDFGSIKEGELAEHIFKFTNSGSAPIVITSVRASCGCTTPEWPKEPIMPNETAEIKAVFNSTGRPGTFYKTITITSNAQENVKRLVIRGSVERKNTAPSNPSPNKSLAQIKVEAPLFQFGKIELGKPIIKSFVCKNTGKSPLMIKGVKSDCACVVLSEKKVIMPNQQAEIELKFTPTSLEHSGENIMLLSNAVNEAKVGFKGQVVESIVTQSPLRETGSKTF